MTKNFSGESAYIKSETWAISEIKATYVTLYGKYLEARGNLIEAINQISDENIAKIHYVVAIDSIYQIAKVHFKQNIIDNKEKYNKLIKTYDIKEIDDCDHIIIRLESISTYGTALKNDTLLFLGGILCEWYQEKGYFRMSNEFKDYGNKEIEIMEDDAYQ